MEEKRRVSVLVPYKVKNGLVSVFLQKRAMDAPRAPSLFGFFGGGADDNETPEETVIREAKEELDFVPDGFRRFSTYELSGVTLSVFAILVGDDFEKRIRVLEGDYGKWFDKDDYMGGKDSITGFLPILDELYEKLAIF